MKQFSTLSRTCALLLGAASFASNAQTSYLAVHSPEDGAGMLVTLDITTCAESNVLPVTLNGVQVEGCTGMALDISTGDVYVVAKQNSNFRLAVLDLTTGALSNPVLLAEKIAGIAFDLAGTLYGISGDGSNTPETLFEIDRTSGALTQIAQPGAGGDGESLALHLITGDLYRYGGTNVFQSIDPSNGSVTDIFISGGSPDNFAHALTYSGGSFILAAGNVVHQVSQNGSLSTLCTMPSGHPGYKGLVNASLVGVPEHRASTPPTIYPNPASDRITVRVEKGGMDRVRVRNAVGAVVIDRQAGGVAQFDLATDELPAGLYTVETLTGGVTRTGTFSVVR